MNPGPQAASLSAQGPPPTIVKADRVQILEDYGLAGLPIIRRPNEKKWPSMRIHEPGYVDPDLTMPGFSNPGTVAPLGAGCGDLYTAMCSRNYQHKTKRGLRQCGIRGCGCCGRDRTKEANQPPPGAEDDETRYHAAEIQDKLMAGQAATDAGRILTGSEQSAIALLNAIADLTRENMESEPEEPKHPKLGFWVKKRLREFLFKNDFLYESEKRRPLPYGNGRLDTYGHRMDLRNPKWYHFIVSPKPRTIGYDRIGHAAMARMARKIAQNMGARDYFMIAHAFRHDGTEVTGPEAYNKQGLHFHFLAISRWIMQGAAIIPKRGRPPAPKDPAKPLQAFDGKIWGPLRSARQEVVDWRFRIIWFAEPTERGIMIRNLKNGGVFVRSGAGYANYLTRFVKYLFHHATYYKGHRHPAPSPFNKNEVKWVRTPGRHGTPVVMPYGRMREHGPPKDDAGYVAWVDEHGEEETHLYRAKETLYGAPKPACADCGAPMREIFDDPMCYSAQLMARLAYPVGA